MARGGAQGDEPHNGSSAPFAAARGGAGSNEPAHGAAGAPPHSMDAGRMPAMAAASPTTHSAPNSGSGSKRRQRGLACVTCRKHKTACSGHMPCDR